MEEMKLGARLIDLRRRKGLTQEQLAERLGVSASAVSKWETNSSYPDITMLCPLARALGTNVDTLLQFEENISDQDVMERLNAVLETAFAEGHEKAEESLLELLHQYPNSACLKFNAAVAWDSFYMFFPNAGDEIRNRWKEYKKKILLELRASGEAAYWQSATLQLASMAIENGELSVGENLLEELPKQHVEPAFTQASLYLKKEEPEEALKIIQKRLYALVSQVQTCLSFMINPKILDDKERLLKILEVYRLVDDTFGLGHLYDGLYLEVYMRMGRYEEAANALVRYADVITGDVILPKKFLFEPGLEPKDGKQAMSKELRSYLVKALEDEQFAPLWDYPQAKEALEKIKND